MQDPNPFKTVAVFGGAFLASATPIDIEGVSTIVTALGQAAIAVFGAIYTIVKLFKNK